MLKSISAVAAALLISLTPAVAADLPQQDRDKAAPDLQQKEAQAQDQTAQPSEQASDDDIQVIIMGKAMQVEVPNPYKNPTPRMLSDAWAMRA